MSYTRRNPEDTNITMLNLDSLGNSSSASKIDVPLQNNSVENKNTKGKRKRDRDPAEKRAANRVAAANSRRRTKEKLADYVRVQSENKSLKMEKKFLNETVNLLNTENNQLKTATLQLQSELEFWKAAAQGNTPQNQVLRPHDLADIPPNTLYSDGQQTELEEYNLDTALDTGLVDYRPIETLPSLPPSHSSHFYTHRNANLLFNNTSNLKGPSVSVSHVKNFDHDPLHTGNVTNNYINGKFK